MRRGEGQTEVRGEGDGLERAEWLEVPREQDGGQPRSVDWTPGETGRGDWVNSFRGHCGGRWESNRGWGRRPLSGGPPCQKDP